MQERFRTLSRNIRRTVRDIRAAAGSTSREDITNTAVPGMLAGVSLGVVAIAVGYGSGAVQRAVREAVDNKSLEGPEGLLHASLIAAGLYGSACGAAILALPFSIVRGWQRDAEARATRRQADRYEDRLYELAPPLRDLTQPQRAARRGLMDSINVGENDEPLKPRKTEVYRKTKEEYWSKIHAERSDANKQQFFDTWLREVGKQGESIIDGVLFTCDPVQGANYPSNGIVVYDKMVLTSTRAVDSDKRLAIIPLSDKGMKLLRESAQDKGLAFKTLQPEEHQQLLKDIQEKPQSTFIYIVAPGVQLRHEESVAQQKKIW